MHRLTRKRQVTIPRAVCDALKLSPGDFVEIFERDGVAQVVKMDNSSLAGRFAEFTAEQKVPSSEALKKALKARALKKFEPFDDSD